MCQSAAVYALVERLGAAAREFTSIGHQLATGKLDGICVEVQKGMSEELIGPAEEITHILGKLQYLGNYHERQEMLASNPFLSDDEKATQMLDMFTGALLGSLLKDLIEGEQNDPRRNAHNN